MFTGILSLTVFLPTLGALAVVLLARTDRQVRWISALVATVTLVLGVLVFVGYDTAGPRFQMVEDAVWFPIDSFPARYTLGVDGLSAPLVFLTALLGFSAVFASWSIKTRLKEYFAWLLLLQTAVTGVFASLDFVLFFLFWELELVPMYFLISIWGTGRREYSAMKFLAFTLLGGAFILVALLILYLSLGTLDIRVLVERGVDTARLIVPASLVFWFFFVGFGIELPTWPVHTWLPDAHTDAPTAVSVMLAGVLLKMGGYGIIRFMAGMFPGLTSTYAVILAVLAVISVLYGATVAMRQTDLRRLVADSSVSHMGLVTLGVASMGLLGGSSAVGLTGASMQMFTHGTITGLLFLLVGVVYERAHTRSIPELGGLASQMPFVAVIFLVAGLASLGLPGLSGFVSELLVFLGSFRAVPLIASFTAFGVVLAAGYILWTLQRVMFGPRRKHLEQVGDAVLVEKIPLAVLALSIVVIGVYPAPLVNVFKAGLEPIARLVLLAGGGQ